jgi:hypothetical protein
MSIAAHQKPTSPAKAASRRIKACLIQRGATVKAVAEATRLSPGSVRNLISGTADSTRGRQAIVDFLNEPIPEWGLTPTARPLAPPTPGQQEIAWTFIAQWRERGKDLAGLPEQERRALEEEFLAELNPTVSAALLAIAGQFQLEPLAKIMLAILPFVPAIRRSQGFPYDDPNLEAFRVAVTPAIPS